MAYSNPEVDGLLEEARVEHDASTRVALYQEAEDMLVKDSPWLPLWYSGEQFVLLKPHVKNYKLTPMIVPKCRKSSSSELASGVRAGWTAQLGDT